MQTTSDLEREFIELLEKLERDDPFAQYLDKFSLFPHDKGGEAIVEKLMYDITVPNYTTNHTSVQSPKRTTDADMERNPSRYHI